MQPMVQIQIANLTALKRKWLWMLIEYKHFFRFPSVKLSFIMSKPLINLFSLSGFDFNHQGARGFKDGEWT